MKNTDDVTKQYIDLKNSLTRSKYLTIGLSIIGAILVGVGIILSSWLLTPAGIVLVITQPILFLKNRSLIQRLENVMKPVKDLGNPDRFT